MSEVWIQGTYASDTCGKIWQESSGVTDVTDLTGVSDLYILKFFVLKYLELMPSWARNCMLTLCFTSAFVSFRKWEEKVGKGFDFGKQDINISLTFLNVSGLGLDTTRNSPSQMGLRKSLSWEERDLYYILL